MLGQFLMLVGLVTSSAALFGFIGHQQSMAVTGRLTCNGKPASGVKVKHYDDEVVSDSKMDQDITNITGDFVLSGKKREVTGIDPKLNIYHKCNYDGFCYKKLSITIPRNYITEGAQPLRIYNIGPLDLANRFKGDSLDCFN